MTHVWNSPKVRDDLPPGLPLGVDEQHEAVGALDPGQLAHLGQGVGGGEHDGGQALVLPGPHTVCLVHPLSAHAALHCIQVKEKRREEKRREEKRREEKSTPFGVSLTRSLVIYQAAQIAYRCRDTGKIDPL